jgi:uncharacterized protein YqeY
LATECREDLEVLKKLLPEPVSPDEIHHFVYDYCVENDFHNNDTLVLPRKFMGVAIKAVKEAFPTADGKMVSEIVKTYVE